MPLIMYSKFKLIEANSSRNCNRYAYKSNRKWDVSKNMKTSKDKCKTRRGKKKKKENTITLFYNNINGLTSKQESLAIIENDIQSDITLLVETKLPKNGRMSDKKQNILHVKDKQGKEGLYIAARKETAHKIVDITSIKECKNIVVGLIKSWLNISYQTTRQC